MNILEWFFGERKTPQERLRQHQRSLERAQREIEREKTKLDAQEKQLVVDIRKSAIAGQIETTKVKAKDLVRTRKQISRFVQIKTQLQAIALRIQTVQTHEQISQNMKKATKLLGCINRTTRLPALMKITHDFEKESDMMEQREEMMDEAIDSIMDDDETENDIIVNQVLDEIGINLRQNFDNLPSITHTINKESQKTTQPITESKSEYYDDFGERLKNLKR
ncbi:ESCRT-III subunit protein DID4 [Pneumocystis jirovecii RU7]|uniref:Uncharacterized protein n=1 Tax=Pneumocystis jirovecii (strain RU7) TaxID=1408657 RepID=A0A0W4ZV42_PNEJ7|nr:ESCRT-III subunit protein DID4 [Pneumocystis jirovecii RU7]KTW32208.1 hypothetical protein T551_00890 [Pneumocystis jirovecii RU7]